MEMCYGSKRFLQSSILVPVKLLFVDVKGSTPIGDVESPIIVVVMKSVSTFTALTSNGTI